MLKNYLKIIFRNMKRHPGFSVINLAGLATSLACVILIMLWVQDELSFDRFHEKADRIGRVIMELDDMSLPASPGPLAPVMISDFPEIDNAVRFVWSGGILEYKDKKFEERDVFLVEPSFLDIFSFPFIKGNPETALSGSEGIVLTETAARKYFGDEDPMGKTVLYSGRIDKPLKVTGIMQDVPHNSHLQFNMLASFDLCRNWKEPDSWQSSQDYQTYVLLDDRASFERANLSLAAFCRQYFEGYNISMFIQPVTEIHLHSDFKFDAGRGDFQYVGIFSLIALAVLIIAGINFMNLSTARFSERAKEVGLRKVVGASRFFLIRRFLSESMLYAALALTGAFVLAEFFLPVFKNITGKPLSVDYTDPSLFLSAAAMLVFTGIMSGSYPAFFLSSFTPGDALKKTMLTGNRGSLFRKVLVITQFSLSIVVIAGTLVVSKQLDFMRNKNLGFDKENVVYLRTGSYFSHKLDALKQDLLQAQSIKSAALSNDIPTYVNLNTGAYWEGKTEESKYIGFRTIVVSEDYLDTYGMKMAEGRFYSKEHPSDRQDAFVVNETAVKTMGLNSPVGKRFSAWGKEGKIIGVVKDFHFKSVKENIEPLMLHLGSKKRFYSYLSLRIAAGDTDETLSYIKDIWEKHMPDSVYELHFLDDSIESLYVSEKRMRSIAAYFAFFAIAISCLGLFGLAVFSSQQRIKEIGIRKVLGAGVSGLAVLLSKDFSKWVLLANLIAWPAAWYSMHRWLQNFAYRIDLTVWPFLLAGMLALGIALLTVSWQAVRAARANPVDSLRYE